MTIYAQATKFRSQLIAETRNLTAISAVKLLANNEFQKYLDMLDYDHPSYVWDFSSQLEVYLAATTIIENLKEKERQDGLNNSKPFKAEVITRSGSLFGQALLLTIRYNDDVHASITVSIAKNRPMEFKTVCPLDTANKELYEDTKRDCKGLGEILVQY